MLAEWSPAQRLRGEHLRLGAPRGVWGRLQQLALSKAGQQAYWSRHGAVVTAIAERDATTAERLMYAHIACVRDAMAGAAPAGAGR